MKRVSIAVLAARWILKMLSFSMAAGDVRMFGEAITTSSALACVLRILQETTGAEYSVENTWRNKASSVTSGLLFLRLW